MWRHARVVSSTRSVTRTPTPLPIERARRANVAGRTDACRAAGGCGGWPSAADADWLPAAASGVGRLPRGAVSGSVASARLLDCVELLGVATPLLAACAEGHVDAARLLLDNGADLHRRDSQGHTPLNLAACYGHIEVVQLLLDSGADADLNVADEDGDTPIANAKAAGNASIVALLEEHQK